MNKYKLGDEVWVMRENKATKDIITSIVLIFENRICYGFGQNTHATEILTRCLFNELDVFPSKKDLLASL